MKGEYIEDDPNNSSGNNQNHHHFFSQLQTHPSKFYPFPTSDEADSSPTLPPPSKPTDDGATVEVTRRPRGRPPGSKNKPKPPPVVLSQEPQPPMAAAMSSCILEIPSGSNIIDLLTRFTRRLGVGLCVLTASGVVINVTLKQPSATAAGGTVTFHGRFDILSLSAVVMHDKMGFCDDVSMTFTITLAGPQGQIVGGKVVNPLMAGSTVHVVAASFNNPTYQRLPLEDDHHPDHHDHKVISNVSGVGGEGSPVSGGGGYGCDVGSAGADVIWAPTSRPPPY